MKASLLRIYAVLLVLFFYYSTVQAAMFYGTIEMTRNGNEELTMPDDWRYYFANGHSLAGNTSWKSDNPSVVRVSSSNKFTCRIHAEALAPTGSETNISCSFSYWEGVSLLSQTIYWTVRIVNSGGDVKVTNIALNNTSISLNVGGTKQLTATVSPSDATNKSVTWSSSNKNVATVSDGLVEAVGEGTTTVTCNANDGSGVKATCLVTVSDSGASTETGIILNKTSVTLYVGEKEELTWKGPSNLKANEITWHSSNENVATTDVSYGWGSGDGGMTYITAKGIGNTIITCQATDGSGLMATCEITVIGPTESWQDRGNYSVSWFNKNKSEFTISTNKELAGMSYLVNNGYTDFAGMTITLGADIDLSGKLWTPCNLFKGTFDGAGHTISGIDIKETLTLIDNTDKESGFWRKLENASIKHLTLKGEEHIQVNREKGNGYYRIGGLVASVSNKSIIENCASDIIIHCKTIRGYAHGVIGGLCGYSEVRNNIFRYCRNTGSIYCVSFIDIQNGYTIGGIIGRSGSEDIISFCDNNAKVYSYVGTLKKSGQQVFVYGGILGQLGYESKILCCKSIIGKIEIVNDFMLSSYPEDTNYIIIGGIVGYLHANINPEYKSSIYNCYSSINSIEVLNAGNTKAPIFYGGIGSYYNLSDITDPNEIANFSNNDVKILTDQQITEVHNGNTDFSSEQMQTDIFLEDLNVYSLLNMDGPVWTQPAEGGYPYITALYETTAIKPIISVESKSTPVFTLSGQRLTAPRKGINIVGGKKVIIK